MLGRKRTASHLLRRVIDYIWFRLVHVFRWKVLLTDFITIAISHMKKRIDWLRKRKR